MNPAERELDAIGEQLMALAEDTRPETEEQPARLRVGTLMVSRQTGRRCRVCGVTGSEACVEYSDNRRNWYHVGRIHRLYVTV